VKFHWFAQYYYTDLPKSYSKNVRSAWVTAPRSVADPTRIGADYHMYLRLMQEADRMGWDSLLVNEHHQTAVAMTPSPNLIAAALACTTETAAIAICGNSLALYNPPVRVAEEIAMLDCLSGGRVIAGLVLGTPMDSAFSYGIPPIELRERFEEARQLIVRAWTADEPFSFNGVYNKLRYVNSWPRPMQDNIPIWVPGSGSVETWDLVNKYDYCYGYLSFRGKESALPIVRGFWDQTKSQGATMNPNRMAFTQVICCSDSEEAAEREYAEAVQYFYRNNPTPPEFGAPPGYMTQDSLRNSLTRETLSPEQRDQRLRASTGELSFWEYDELGYIIAGTPETVERRVRELAEQLRVGQLITCMHMGNLSEEAAMKNIHLFGNQVIPKLRDIWADEEDRWTPRVTQERVAARELARVGA